MSFLINIGGLPAVDFSPFSAQGPLKTISQEIAQSVFTNATIATRMLQLLPALANTQYVPTHMALEMKIGVAFTSNPTNIVLSAMADPSTGSEGDMTDGTFGFRGDGALGSLGNFRHYQANMLTLNVATNQVGIAMIGQPLWFVPRSQLTGAGTITKAVLTVKYYEVRAT